MSTLKEKNTCTGVQEFEVFCEFPDRTHVKLDSHTVEGLEGLQTKIVWTNSFSKKVTMWVPSEWIFFKTKQAVDLSVKSA
jgi:hypothetical protein